MDAERRLGPTDVGGCLGPQVPEGVPGVAWLPHQIAAPASNLSPSDTAPMRGPEDEAELVLAAVQLERRDQRSRWRVVLDERQPAVGVGRCQQKPILRTIRRTQELRLRDPQHFDRHVATPSAMLHRARCGRNRCAPSRCTSGSARAGVELVGADQEAGVDRSARAGAPNLPAPGAARGTTSHGGLTRCSARRSRRGRLGRRGPGRGVAPARG